MSLPVGMVYVIRMLVRTARAVLLTVGVVRVRCALAGRAAGQRVVRDLGGNAAVEMMGVEERLIVENAT